jgi:hypothetical protein
MANFECIKLDCKIRSVCEILYDTDDDTDRPPCAAKTCGTQPLDVQQIKAEILPLVSNAFSALNSNLPYDSLGYMRKVMAKLTAIA